jgi:hypothetical protein
MKLTTVFLLCSALVLPSLGWADDPSLAIQKKIAKIPKSDDIVVHLRDKTKLRGRLGKMSATGFQLCDQWCLSFRQIPFSEVHSVRQIRRPWEPPARVLGLAVLGAFCGINWIFTRDFCSDL